MSCCEKCGCHLDENQCSHETWLCDSCCDICTSNKKAEYLENKIYNLEKKIEKLEKKIGETK